MSEHRVNTSCATCHRCTSRRCLGTGPIGCEIKAARVAACHPTSGICPPVLSVVHCACIMSGAPQTTTHLWPVALAVCFGTPYKHAWHCMCIPSMPVLHAMCNHSAMHVASLQAWWCMSVLVPDGVCVDFAGQHEPARCAAIGAAWKRMATMQWHRCVSADMYKPTLCVRASERCVAFKPYLQA